MKPQSMTGIESAKENNDMADSRKTMNLDFILAMEKIEKAMKICEETGFDFDELVRRIRASGSEIGMYSAVKRPRFSDLPAADKLREALKRVADLERRMLIAFQDINTLHNNFMNLVNALKKINSPEEIK